jgi:hypothetical protein
MDDLMIPDACTLPSAERPLRLAEFDDLLARHVRSVDRDGDRVRLHLTGGEGLRERVRDLTERESQCCSFFEFTITGEDPAVTLEVTVPPGQRDVLTALAERASALAS